MNDRQFYQVPPRKVRLPCMRLSCSFPPESGGSLCRKCWLALPTDLRREIIRATNAFTATRNTQNQERFRIAWGDAVTWINSQPVPAEEVTGASDQ